MSTFYEVYDLAIYEVDDMVNISCSDNVDYLKLIPDGAIKLLVTSPPYDIGKSYEKRTSLQVYIEHQEKVISECVRVMAENGSLCWQIGNHITLDGEVVPLDMILYPIFKAHGLTLRNRIVWHFEHGLHCSKRFSGRYETILWFTKTKNYTFNLDPVRVPSKYPNKRYFKGPKAGQLSCNPLGKNPGDVWIIPNVKANHCEKLDHPCQFPVELIERLILSMTNEGDSVLDPYMGSGSTIIAAIKNRRKGWGCDIEPKYVKMTQERAIAYRSGTLKTRAMGTPIYNPDLPGGGQK